MVPWDAQSQPLPWHGVYIKLISKDYACGIIPGQPQSLGTDPDPGVGGCVGVESLGQEVSCVPGVGGILRDGMKIQYFLYDITPVRSRTGGSSGYGKYSFQTKPSGSSHSPGTAASTGAKEREKLFIPCDQEELGVLIRALGDRDPWFNSPTSSSTSTSTSTVIANDLRMVNNVLFCE